MFYLFQIIVTDQGIPPLSASASVIINVHDVNDKDPVFEPDMYEAQVAEDDPPGKIFFFYSFTLIIQ